MKIISVSRFFEPHKAHKDTEDETHSDLYRERDYFLCNYCGFLSEKFGKHL